MSENFENAVAIAKSYSNKVDYDTDLGSMRVIVDPQNVDDLTVRISKLGYVKKTNYKLSDGRLSLVFEPDYQEGYEDDDQDWDLGSQWDPDDEEAPPF